MCKEKPVVAGIVARRPSVLFDGYHLLDEGAVMGDFRAQTMGESDDCADEFAVCRNPVLAGFRRALVAALLQSPIGLAAHGFESVVVLGYRTQLRSGLRRRCAKLCQSYIKRGSGSRTPCRNLALRIGVDNHRG